MEAGNRCYDERVPEEANRKIVDTLSDWLLPYTQRSRENLLREGYHPSKVIVTGNPIAEIVAKYLGDETPLERKEVLVTLHRSENVGDENVLRSIVSALGEIAETHPVTLSIHPKLEEMLRKFQIRLHENVSAAKPF
jgi:UDP-N-acetylglucosamine 2-epimerase (non-hydrolysing)